MLIIDPTQSPTKILGTCEKTAEATWNPLLQQFVPLPTDTQTVDVKDAVFGWETAIKKALGKLASKPAVQSITPDGRLNEQPPRKFLCPTCKKPHLVLPVVVEGDTYITSIKTGKGTVRCTNCDYTGKKAMVKAYTMYEYADLIRNRYALAQQLETTLDTLNDQLAG